MPRYLFITGKLAAEPLGNILKDLPLEFEHALAVMPISVAALMDTSFIAKHLERTGDLDCIVIPGLCGGTLSPIEEKFGVRVIRGPKSLKDLPSFFGQVRLPQNYGEYAVKIIAEIVDAHLIGLDAIMERASYFRGCGADVIDLGCPVSGGFPEIGIAVNALKDRGYTVSVDSFNPDDIMNADAAGVDYALSVNSQNIDLARRLRCKVVVIPDSEGRMESLDRNIAQLEAWGVPYIIDPVLSPIGLGFADSIGNYISVRRKFPESAMLMGIGNLTELTDADTTGITALMAGIVEELKINYVLTTEVISWARGAVREFDIARRLMHYACENRMIPKHMDDALITVKDPPFETFSEEELKAMKAKVRDRNFRVFVDRDMIYVFNNRLFVKGSSPKDIFRQLKVEDVGEGFYLGAELEKASLAIQLGKRYVQEQDLRWGYLNHFQDLSSP
jgi:dihydropteroate synthase-like protein